MLSPIFFDPPGTTPPARPDSHKTLKVKKLLAVNARRNRPLPQWTRMKTSANPKVKQPKYNSKRKNWRKTKLGI